MTESYYKYVKSTDASKHAHPIYVWTLGETYAVGNWVWHNGSAYQVKVAHVATAETEPGGSIDGFFTFTYIAYAVDDQGTGFTRTFDAALDYIGILNTSTRIGSPSASDFTGLWKLYKGGSGNWVYVAYASDASGTDFTLTFDADLDYVAILVSDIAIPSPTASNFTGLWKNYKGPTGTPGSYMYVAYASDDQGTGFTLTFDPALNYIAVLRSDTEIPAPSASDFAGLWKNYKGTTGEAGTDGAAGLDGANAYTYIAYAYDAAGTGFTTTFNASLDYIAILSTATEIPAPAVEDFTGLWKNYKGAQGERGFTHKGAWSAGTTYDQYDAVGYSNNTWLALQGTNLNHTPAEGAWWTLIISGAGVSNHRVYSAIPIPAPDGIVSVFTLPESFVSGSEKVNLNGLEQLGNTDYTTDPSNGEITWIGTPLPPTGSILIVDYDHDDVMRTSNTLLHGTGAPSDANDGIDGDYYKDDATTLFYGPKAAGAWPAGVDYHGDHGDYIYVAYASDDTGTDYTLTFDPLLNYIAVLRSATEIATPLVADFAGLWKNYKGVQGSSGGISGPYTITHDGGATQAIVTTPALCEIARTFMICDEASATRTVTIGYAADPDALMTNAEVPHDLNGTMSMKDPIAEPFTSATALIATVGGSGDTGSWRYWIQFVEYA